MKKIITINLLVIIAIIVFINLLSVDNFKRLDFSKDKMYSLSDASMQAVANLDDRVVVKAYFSDDLTPQLADVKRYTEDLLTEYQAYSKGKLKFEFINPDSDEDAKAEAKKNMVEPRGIQVNENEKIVTREVFLGLAFLYQGRTETVPFIVSTQGLEYEITSTIMDIKAPAKRKIGVFKPESLSRDMFGRTFDNYQTFNAILQQNNEIEAIDFTEPVKDHIKGIFITGITDSLSTDQLYNLDQYIMNGGSVIFFQDKVVADQQRLTAQDISTNLFDLLSNYGVNVKSNVIGDANCDTRVFSFMNRGRLYRYQAQYPFQMYLTEFNPDNDIVSDLEILQMFAPSEIDTTNIAENIEFTPLIFTSAKTERVGGPNYDMSFYKYLNKDVDTLLVGEKACVAGLYKGSFKSFFANNADYPDALVESTQANIIYLADNEILMDNGIQNNNRKMAQLTLGNKVEFILNSIDYISGNESLIKLRSRGVAYKPLKEDISSAKKKTIKWLNILLPSSLLLVLGLIIFRINRIKKRMIEDKYVQN